MSASAQLMIERIIPIIEPFFTVSHHYCFIYFRFLFFYHDFIHILFVLLLLLSNDKANATSSHSNSLCISVVFPAIITPLVFFIYNSLSARCFRVFHPENICQTIVCFGYRLAISTYSTDIHCIVHNTIWSVFCALKMLQCLIRLGLAIVAYACVFTIRCRHLILRFADFRCSFIHFKNAEFLQIIACCNSSSFLVLLLLLLLFLFFNLPMHMQTWQLSVSYRCQ